MIYVKVTMKLDFEMNIPLQGVDSVDEAAAQIEKEGGQEAFIKSMGDEVLKGFASPFTTGKMTDGKLDIVKV